MKIKLFAIIMVCHGTAMAAPPTNDNFISAVQLTGLAASISGTTLEATSTYNSADEDYFGEEGTAGTVWYKWTAPAGVTAARITVNFNGEPGECMVRTGNSAFDIVGGMAQYLPSVKEAGWRSFDISTTPGTEYRIKVADRNGSSVGNTFSLSLTTNLGTPPANDTQATAISLPSQPSLTITGSFQNATSEKGETYLTDGTSTKYANTPGAVWYRWQAPVSGDYGVTVIGQKYLRVQVVSYSNTLKLIVDTLRGPNGIEAIAGQQYYIKVISDVGGSFFSGSFQLVLAPEPYADKYVTESPPRPLEQSLNYQLAGSTQSLEDRPYAPAYAPLVPNVYCYLTTYPAATRLTPGIWEIGGYDPKVLRVTVFHESPTYTYSPVATNDSSGVTRFVVSVSNAVYYAEVSLAFPENAMNSESLSGTLTLRQVPANTAPANDSFANSILLNSQPLTSVKGTTIGASGEIFEEFSERDEGVIRDIASRSVWYRWIPLVSANHYIIALDEENKPLHVRITQGTLGALGNLGSDATIRDTGVLVNSGETYNICVDDDNRSSTGNFRLFIGRNLSFDNFANRQFIASNAFGIASWRYGNSLGMTLEAEPDLGNIDHTAWFEYRASSATPLYINTFGSSYDTVLHVYTGTSLDALTLVASNDDFSTSINRTSALSFIPVAGTSYKIRVAGFSTGKGIFALQVGQQPVSWKPYEIWALNYDWMAPEHGELMDPDGDGLKNIEECVFGGHPLIPENRRSPSSITNLSMMLPQLLSPPNFGINYRIFPPNLIGQGIGTPITVTPEISGNLLGWIPVTPTTTAGITTVTVGAPAYPITKIFLRTKVSSNP